VFHDALNDSPDWAAASRLYAKEMKRATTIVEEAAMALLFLVLSLVFFFIWLFSFVMFHVAGGAIHILLILAVISIIVHFIRRASSHTNT
jgi:Family of unknown function (DUF5670)